ncbi:DUF3429 domain-containing protein [Noviherbaspirillum saxi]|uniref:DUF3429 domain-containing protein n=1 Tax=Noviherbaspirillum saxi TaxID=2320863 RepID=A0A3A3GBR2_9BURK|nr:DUF3429 domain-containing protein [Noviherbaspirillum saxi]RJF99635.1 DUF3429 domain-containing protein [Noviherbaspirillum saxi]
MNTHFVNKRVAHLLGYAGLIPFVLLMLGCWVAHPDWLGDFIRGQLAYGIAILSFLGGIHWGAVMVSPDLTMEQTRKGLVWSISPALIAWSSTLMGGFGFAVLMLGFIAAYQADKRLSVWYGMPDWFVPLRLKLTCIVIAALMLSVIAANVRG